MHSNLLNLVAQIAELESKELDLIKSCFKPFFLAKGAFYLRAGEINKHVGFLDKGLVRYFVYKNEEESTFEFTKEGEFIADYQSFNNLSASLQNIQAIEDCELLIINYPDVQTIFNTTKNGNLIGRHIIEHRFDVMVSRLLALYMQTPEERYKSFVDHYADLTQRIPQYLIASFVGVQPQSLSRIRKRFAQGLS
jgi:CRP-like cAMP-binding protein